MYVYEDDGIIQRCIHIYMWEGAWGKTDWRGYVHTVPWQGSRRAVTMRDGCGWGRCRIRLVCW